mmetsp:Transcript_2044/g.5168  ORF Transcript_2044/g.5168 Transcript_2044/m.5168 type:complete len:128 (+) Transcript_2044:1691-2074(+)
MPIMLLRNINPREGLCNGTRLLVERVENVRLLHATIITKCREVRWPQGASAPNPAVPGHGPLSICVASHTVPSARCVRHDHQQGPGPNAGAGGRGAHQPVLFSRAAVRGCVTCGGPGEPPILRAPHC